MQECDDITLLREYAERDSEEAFGTLVTRHIDKVYSVALRHTRNPSQAEEITQAVFVILAQKACKLGNKVILSAWLYQTARWTTVTLLRSEKRRALREEKARMQTLLNETQSDVWLQIAPLLDAAMARLSEKDRQAVVLRFFDGKSMREIGNAMGASEDAAKMRVNRAVEKLRLFFTKRGVAASAAVLTAAISVNSVQAAPAALAKTATVVAMTKGAAASTSTLTLIKGALKIMAYKKTAVIATGIVVALLIGVTISIPAARTAIKSLPQRIENHTPAEQRRAALVQQMETMKMSVWPAIMKYSQEHNGQFPKSMDELRPYLPPGLAGMDDNHWRITAGTWNAKPTTPSLLTFCEQINQPAGEPRIILYADGHVERRR